MSLFSMHEAAGRRSPCRRGFGWDSNPPWGKAERYWDGADPDGQVPRGRRHGGLVCPAPCSRTNRGHNGRPSALANIRSEEDMNGHVLNMQRKVPLPAMQWFRESRRHHF